MYRNRNRNRNRDIYNTSPSPYDEQSENISTIKITNISNDDYKYVNDHIINKALNLLMTFYEIIKKNKNMPNINNCVNLEQSIETFNALCLYIQFIYIKDTQKNRQINSIPRYNKLLELETKKIELTNVKNNSNNTYNPNYSYGIRNNYQLNEINKMSNYPNVNIFIIIDYYNLLIFNLIILELLNKTSTTNITKLTFNNIKTELYPYQIKNVNWMINIENNAYDIKNKNKIVFRGGGLFDEVGMGKTLQIISLINENVSTYPSRIKNNKLYGRATLIIVPTHLCGQWDREFEKHIIKPLNIISLLTKNNCKKYTTYDLTVADIVIVSSRFFINCCIEPIHYVNEQRKILGIFSKCNCKNSKNCVCEYINLYDIHWHRTVLDEYHEIEKDDIFKKFKQLTSDYRWILSGTPLKQQKINNIYEKLDTSLSNIIDYLCFKENTLCELDHTNITNYEYILSHFSRNKHCDNIKILKLPEIVEEIVWLNFTDTERMIYNAHIIGDCENNTDDYRTGDTEHELFLRQICCHPFISSALRNLNNESNVCDLEQMKDKIKTLYIDDYNNTVDRYNKYIERNNKIKEHMKEIEDENKTYLKEYSNCQDELLEMQKHIDKSLKEKNIKENTLNYYKNFMEILSNKEKIAQCKCIICLTEIDENDIGITTCNHMFCYSCINMIIATSSISCSTNKCPTCNKPLSMKDVYMISKKEVTEDVNKMGTKLAYIINYIKNTPEKYRIIFSQFDYLLKEVGKILSDNNIPNVFCQGGVFQKDNALRLFNNSDENNDKKCRVLMMSSKSTVSGANLSNAEEVIFLDIFSGTKQERLNGEQQAIGRVRRLGNKFKTIKVLRLLVKQSIEEVIYKKNIAIDT